MMKMMMMAMATTTTTTTLIITITTNTPIYYLLNAFNLNSPPNIKLKSTITQETKNFIKSLKPKNAYGYDKIPANLLKINSVYINSPLSNICNMYLSLGIFP
jgi:hypothetical protein